MPRYEGFGPPYNPGPGYHWEYTSTYTHHDEVSHTEPKLVQKGNAVIMSKRGVPIRYVKAEDVWAGLNWETACSKRELTEGWMWAEDLGTMQSGEDRIGPFHQKAYKIKNPNAKGLHTEDVSQSTDSHGDKILNEIFKAVNPFD